jgi:putative tryptophan/tyrosine transport system substrate-binding protein
LCNPSGSVGKFSVSEAAVSRPVDGATGLEAFKERADALYVCADPLIVTNRLRISRFALAARLPTMHGQRENVAAGGLLSYGPNFPDLHRRAADYVDKILREARRSSGRAADQVRFL